MIYHIVALMTELERLIADAEAYANTAGLSISTVSRKLFGDGTRIHKMKAGQGSALASTINRAREKLSEMTQTSGEAA